MRGKSTVDTLVFVANKTQITESLDRNLFALEDRDDRRTGAPAAIMRGSVRSDGVKVLHFNTLLRSD